MTPLFLNSRIVWLSKISKWAQIQTDHAYTSCSNLVWGKETFERIHPNQKCNVFWSRYIPRRYKLYLIDILAHIQYIPHLKSSNTNKGEGVRNFQSAFFRSFLLFPYTISPTSLGVTLLCNPLCILKNVILKSMQSWFGWVTHANVYEMMCVNSAFINGKLNHLNPMTPFLPLEMHNASQNFH